VCGWLFAVYAWEGNTANCLKIWEVQDGYFTCVTDHVLFTYRTFQMFWLCSSFLCLEKQALQLDCHQWAWVAMGRDNVRERDSTYQQCPLTHLVFSSSSGGPSLEHFMSLDRFTISHR